MAPPPFLAAPVFAGSKPFLLLQLLSAFSDLLPFPFVSPLSLFRRWLFAKRPQYLTGHNISQTAGLDRKPPICPVGVKMPTHCGFSQGPGGSRWDRGRAFGILAGWGLETSRRTWAEAEFSLSCALDSLYVGWHIPFIFLLPPLSLCLSSPGCVYWEPALSQHQEAKVPVLTELPVWRGDRQIDRLGYMKSAGTKGCLSRRPGEARTGQSGQAPSRNLSDRSELAAGEVAERVVRPETSV